MTSLDWDDLKFVHAIVRHGSLSAAARALGTTQPTVSRRLSALEKRIGGKLFEREADGLVPSALCASFIDALDQMDQQAQKVVRRIAGRGTALEGTITLTSLGWFGDDILAPLLARFASLHEHISIDLISDPRRFNLSRREADIAVRIGSFDQEDLHERKVADISYGLYASLAYVERHGMPDFAQDGAGHLIVSHVETPVHINYVEWLEAIAGRARVTLKTNGIQSQIAVAEAGEAMAVLPRVLGDRKAGLQRITPPLAEPFYPVKLGVHADLRDTPRIRSLIDFLVQELKRIAGALHPTD